MFAHFKKSISKHFVMKKGTFRFILLRAATSAVYTLHTLYIFKLNYVELSLGFLNNS